MSNYATLFYKVKFSISAVPPVNDLLWKIVMHVKDWQTRKCKKRQTVLSSDLQDWTRLKWGGRLSAEDGSICLVSEFFETADSDSKYWACQVIEKLPPDPGYANRQWITEIGYEQECADSAMLSCVVSYSDRAGFIGPYMDTPTPSMPNLIRDIVRDPDIHCFYGADELLKEPQKLEVGGWPDFYRKIMNPNRKFPYIFISPQIMEWESRKTAHLINPKILAEKIFGNALVFYADNVEFSREMSYMNAEYECFGGGIRVYQPNCQDPARHRYMSASDIQAFGEETVINFLLRAFSQNANFYDSFFCLEECKRKKGDAQREKRRAELLEAHRTHLEQMQDEYLQDYIAEEEKRLQEEERRMQEEEKRLQAELDLSDIKEQLAEEKQKTYNLEVQVEQFRSAAKENAGLNRSLNARFEVTTLPSTTEEVMDYFNRTFADRIAFSEDARKSSKRCKLAPNELWKVFFALSNTLCNLYRKPQGDIFAEFRCRTGIDAVRGEGPMTRKNKDMMRQFETEFDGELIDIEAHITYSKLRQSIHFGYSDKLKKVVIGHCGEHLDNYSTRKVK